MALRTEQAVRDVLGSRLVGPPEEPAEICPSPAWNGWQRLAKRGLDVVCASLLLVLLSPLLVLIALVVKFDSRGPAIFSQTRLGRGGKPFKYYKFRSMVVDAEKKKTELATLNEVDGPIFKMRRDPRLTRVGGLLRRTSLDELPQLWNVLRGDMSLVGPRPPIPSEVAHYQEWHHHRLRVPMGLTGLWQVSGRSQLTFGEMVRLDINYIEQWSFWLDLRILLQTVLVVITTRGAY